MTVFKSMHQKIKMHVCMMHTIMACYIGTCTFLYNTSTLKLPLIHVSRLNKSFFENESAFQNLVNQHSTLFLYFNISDIAFLIEPITCVSYFNPFSALCLLPRFNSQSNDKVVRRIVIVWARMTIA